MSKEESEIEKSIKMWNNRPVDEYKDWLFKEIKSNEATSIFLKKHIENFLGKHEGKIGIESNILLQKLFFICLEFKNYANAYHILVKLVKEFGHEKGLLRMNCREREINPDGGNIAETKYKELMIYNQYDNESIKNYILLMKKSMNLSDKQSINDYIELWNLYLEAFMNDPDAFNELSQVYLMANEYDKAAFCLEELLLYTPDDYKVLTKLGDIYTSKNNAADAKQAINFYSRAILIKPNARAFFGIQNCVSIIMRKEKKLEEKIKELVNISKQELIKMYDNSPFKSFDVNKIFK